jgi:hypothetical protein
VNDSELKLTCSQFHHYYVFNIIIYYEMGKACRACVKNFVWKA